MLKANVRDAVALMEMAAILDNEIPKGKGGWNEFKVSQKITQLRGQQDLFKGIKISNGIFHGVLLL